MYAERQVNTEVKRQLRQMGYCKPNCGTLYLIRAIEIVTENPDIIYRRLATKWLYPMIAKEYHTTSTSAEAGIRRVVMALWANGNRSALNEIAGYILPKRPTNSEFIMMLSEYLMAHWEVSEKESSSTGA